MSTHPRQFLIIPPCSPITYLSHISTTWGLHMDRGPYSLGGFSMYFQCFSGFSEAFGVFRGPGGLWSRPAPVYVYVYIHVYVHVHIHGYQPQICINFSAPRIILTFGPQELINEC